MDFGKVSSLEGISFNWPDTSLPNSTFFENLNLPNPKSPVLYVGATGYHMRQWVGTFYPKGTRPPDYLQAYGLQFNSIEHNTTYYRVPDIHTVGRWIEKTPEDFKFCPKIPRLVSHSRSLETNSNLMFNFVEQVLSLEERLGVCFLQLPPHFGPNKLPALDKFLNRYSRMLSLAVEVRHPAFFLPTLESEDFFQLLQVHQAAAVITDVAGRRDVCHMRLTAPFTFIRFVGNDHFTDTRRLEAWVYQLAQWFANGLQTVYFFTHTPENLHAPELSSAMVKMAKASIPNLSVRGPVGVKPAIRQGELFATIGEPFPD